MREHMPGQTGWTDRGPRARPQAEQVHSAAKAVIKQGDNSPRQLTPAQATLANINRVLADADAAALEKWYRDGCLVPESAR